jgi:hypothetical protein
MRPTGRSPPRCAPTTRRSRPSRTRSASVRFQGRHRLHRRSIQGGRSGRPTEIKVNGRCRRIGASEADKGKIQTEKSALQLQAQGLINGRRRHSPATNWLAVEFHSRWRPCRCRRSTTTPRSSRLSPATMLGQCRPHHDRPTMYQDIKLYDAAATDARREPRVCSKAFADDAATGALHRRAHAGGSRRGFGNHGLCHLHADQQHCRHRRRPTVQQMLVVVDHDARGG